MESGVEFVAVDMPQANRLTIHILAAVAEHERELISQRTKAVLQAAKRLSENYHQINQIVSDLLKLLGNFEIPVIPRVSGKCLIQSPLCLGSNSLFFNDCFSDSL